MNAIQLYERVAFYNDTTRNGRFSFLTINKGVNDAINKFIDQQMEGTDGSSGFQKIQQVRDNLYTLIKTATPAITTGSTITGRYGSAIPNHIVYPADYRDFVAIQTLISGYSDFARPIEYGELGTVLNDSFRMPSNIQIYYNEDATGWTIYRGATGSLTTVTLTYIKDAAEFSIGNESLLIDEGPGVLVIGQSYIATETSVQNGITYQPGDQFIAAATTTLASGQVILASNTTACDLPSRTHEEIAKLASAIISGTVSDFNRSAFVNKEAAES